MFYKAFVSYSRAADGKLAPALQSALHRFARPWYRLRAIRIFRDVTNLSVSPGLWSSIETALSNSEYLVLLASPQAAASKWVQREVDYWLDRSSVEKLLIIITEGEVAWDSATGDFGWDGTNALPRNLAGVFREEPLYLDFRSARTSEDLSLANPAFRDKIADLAATLHGRPKDELIGEDVRQHRKARRLAWSAAAALFVLTLAAIAGAYFAVDQRNIARANADEAKRQEGIARYNEKEAIKNAEEARQQQKRAETEQKRAETNATIAEERRRVALARQIATQAEWTKAQRADLLERSALLGVEAIRRLPSLETDQALRQALDLLPHSVARFTHNDDVSLVAFSADGKFLATTDRLNIVRIWDVATRQPVDSHVRYSEANGPVYAAALSPDWKLLAAASRDLNVRIWRMGKGDEAVTPMRHERPVSALTFSPNGRYLATAEDRRARIWDVRTGEQIATMTPPGQDLSGEIAALAFSPDGRHLATARRDLVILWETTTGKQVAGPILHQGAVTALSFSPTGKLLATSTAMSTAHIWDAATGAQSMGLIHQGRVTALAFSPDERLLVTASQGDNSARVWEVARGQQVAGLPHESPISTIAFRRDGRYLATAGSDNTARLWEVSSNREVARMVHAGPVHGIAFSPDGEYLATASSDDTARLWEATNGAEGVPMKYRSQDGWRTAVAFGPRGNYLAAASDDATISIWDSASRRVSRMTYLDRADAVSISPNGKWAALVLKGEATGKDDNTVQIQELPGGREVARLKHEGMKDWDAIEKRESARGISYRVYRPEIEQMKREGTVRVQAFSPDGRYLVTISVEGVNRVARVWDMTGRREISRVSYPYEGTIDVVFSRNSRLLAIAIGGGYRSTVERTLQVLELPGGQAIAHLSKRGHYPVVFSPDGGYMATSSSDSATRIGEVTTWDVASGKKISVIRQQDHIRNVDFSPDGRYLITRDVAGFGHIWGATSGREISHMTNQPNGPVSFSLDGRYLAAAQFDHGQKTWLVTVWDSKSGRRLAQLKQEPHIHDVVFSPDARFLATASGEDGAARIWEIHEGKEITRVRIKGLNALAFSPDGRYLVTGDSDQNARIWLWRPEDLITETCSRVTRNLTLEEWRQYFDPEPFRPTCPRPSPKQ